MPHPPTYETFEHGADIGVRGIGRSLEEALAMAAKAMFSLMVDNLENVPAKTQVEIQVEGFDMESLLLAWLNQLLAEADINGLVFSEFSVSLKGRTLRGTATGSDFSGRDPGVEVKAATYSEAAVSVSDGIWTAQCVVDV
ncbi:MAG: archease [Desulfohalobiaceae bacterium]|nr:archease [Desulfohalobiaceae bacterium]